MGKVFHKRFHFVFGIGIGSVRTEFFFHQLSSAVTFSKILFFSVFRELFALLDGLLDVIVEKEVVHR
jgi:hypothetical protein